MSTWDDRMQARVEPRLQLVETCWRFRRHASRRVIDCAIYATDVGLEVRIARGASELLHSHLFHDPERAQRYAEQLRQDMRAKGSFEELPVVDP